MAYPRWWAGGVAAVQSLKAFAEAATPSYACTGIIFSGPALHRLFCHSTEHRERGTREVGEDMLFKLHF